MGRRWNCIREDGKNLFICNRQKTSFYLLMMPGDKSSKPRGGLEVFVAKIFNELTTTELYEILKARATVFVVEQNIVYQDMDVQTILLEALWDR